ncbi:MAG: hypothetical protein HQL87_00975 [Magnetococcales bacterium]|nr:hypothetical protein [Magnetococcales bacterium]
MNAPGKTKTLFVACMVYMAVAGGLIADDCPPGPQKVECQQEKERKQHQQPEQHPQREQPEKQHPAAAPQRPQPEPPAQRPTAAPQRPQPEPPAQRPAMEPQRPQPGPPAQHPAVAPQRPQPEPPAQRPAVEPQRPQPGPPAQHPAAEPQRPQPEPPAPHRAVEPHQPQPGPVEQRPAVEPKRSQPEPANAHSEQIDRQPEKHHDHSVPDFGRSPEPTLPVPPSGGNINNRETLPHTGDTSSRPGHLLSPAAAPPNKAGTASHAIPINQNVQAIRHGKANDYTIIHHPKDGSEVVFRRQRLPDGQTFVSGYKQTLRAEGSGWTRTYLDGRRVSVNPQYVERSDPLRPFDVITHHNGLREGFTHTGRPAFHEIFTEIQHNNRHEQVVQRIMSVTMANHTVVPLAAPILQYYAIVPFGDITVFSYYPASRDAEYYAMLYRPIALSVTQDCTYCPPPVIVYEHPVAFYSDPIVLLSDMTLATPLYEGMMPVASNAHQAEIDALQNQFSALQQTVNHEVQGNTELLSQLADLQMDPQAMNQPMPGIDTSRTEQVMVPEDVREQIKQQIIQALAYQKEGKNLSIIDVITSPKASHHLFQVAETIDAINADSGEDCTLTSGDLISFNTVPIEGDSSASMLVTVSKKKSCPMGAHIHVGLYDLQEMLNSFNQNLEKNMEELHKHIAQ